MNRKIILPLFTVLVAFIFWNRSDYRHSTNISKKKSDEKIQYALPQTSVATDIEDKIKLSQAAIRKIETSSLSKEDQLFNAIAKADLEEVIFLIDHGADIEGRDKFGNTALLKSLDEGHLEIAQKLLDRGANGLVTNQSGLSVATAAALQFEADLFKDLVEKGAAVNPPVLGKMNLLMNLAMEGNDDMVGFILEKAPADIDNQDTFGNTALHYAVQGGHEKVVRELLAYKAQTELRNSDGLTPLEWAKKEDYQPIVKLISKRKKE